MFSPRLATTYTLAFILSLFPNFHSSQAESPQKQSTLYNIKNPQGETIFQVRFDQAATFSDPEKQTIQDAFSYWARILKKGPKGLPAIVEVTKFSGGEEDKGILARYSDEGTGLLLEPLMNGKPPVHNFHSHGRIKINQDQKFSLSLERTSNDICDPNLYTVIAHEIGHGVFDSKAKTDGSYIQDVLGFKNTALHGVVLDGPHINSSDSLMFPFYVSKKGTPLLSEVELAFFQDQGWLIDRRDFFGRSLYESNLKIANKMGYSERNPEGTDYIQGYNSNPFGIGFYIYGSKNEIDQDADILTKGERSIGVWINGENNKFTLNHMKKVHSIGDYGIGIILGKKNNELILKENAEIYANGSYGIGIHINEESNSLTLDKGAKIQANGVNGTGIRVSHSIKGPLILDGEISALGEKGIGLSFDSLNPGAKTIHINGSLSGAEKALYIGQSGFVRDIKIASGAQVWGDIISNYRNLSWDSYSTYVTFGYDSDKNMDIGDKLKNEKKITYSHALKGGNLKVEIAGLAAFYNKQIHAIQNLTIAEKASLEGNGTFRLATWEDSAFYRFLNEEKSAGKISQEQYEDYETAYAPLHRGYFYNQGLLSPSSETSHIGSMIIDGSFWQDEKGTLAIDIAEDGTSDTIHVTQDAHLGGALEIRPEMDFFYNGWDKDIVFLTTEGVIKNDFQFVNWTLSPTMTWGFEAVKENNKVYGVRLSENSNHTPDLDPRYKNELQATQKYESDARLRQDQPEQWGEIEDEARDDLRRAQEKYEQDKLRQEERLTLEIDLDKRRLIFDGIHAELRGVREDLDKFDQEMEFSPKQCKDKDTCEVKYENLRVSFIDFRLRAAVIADAYQKQRDSLDTFYAQETLSSEQKKEAESHRRTLGELKNDYDKLIREFHHYMPANLKGAPDAPRRHKSFQNSLNFNDLFPKRKPKGLKDLKGGVTLKIPVNAYSQYATLGNEREVGIVLDRLRRLSKEAVTPALQTLYAALDFSAPNGSEVRSALGQLSPVAYGGFFSASLNREYVITDTLKARPSTLAAPIGHWYGFVLPFASQVQEKSMGLQVGYSARTSGVVFGVEQDASSLKGLTWGIHGVVGQKGSLNFKTADNARGTLQAWSLGVQMHYQPNLHEGLDIGAHVRLGLEQGSMTRSLSFASYSGEQQGKWLGWTSSSAVSGAYLWSLNPVVSIGPLVGLEYVTVSRPSIMERGSHRLNFVLDSTSFDSLRSSLGLRGIVFVSEKLKMDLQARWDRELLSMKVHQGVGFVGYSDDGFFYADSVSIPRQDVYVSSQATYDVNSKVSIGARAAVQFTRFAKPELSGNLALKVRF